MKRLLSIFLAFVLSFGMTLSLVGCALFEEDDGKEQIPEDDGGNDVNIPGGDGYYDPDGWTDIESGTEAKISYKSASVSENGKMTVTLSNGLSSTVSLPENPEGIVFDDAEISGDGRLIVYYSDGYYLTTSALPTYNKAVESFSLSITDLKLVSTVNGSNYELCKIFYPTVPLSPLTPEGASAYAETRDVTGRSTATVIISVKGYGDVTLLLDATTAPITVANFLELTKSGFYDGLTFHRVISGFMIQGGDPNGNGSGGSSSTIQGEFDENGWENDISHKRGVISMARSNDPDSASSQFFICNADASSSLDGKYAAFGYVLCGMNIIDEITSLTEPYADYYSSGTILDSTKQAVIESITVLEDLAVR